MKAGWIEMPNWVENFTYVIGSEARRKEFVDAVNGSRPDRPSLANLWPMPSCLVDTTSPPYKTPEPDAEWLERLSSNLMTAEQYDNAVRHRQQEYEKGQAAFEETGFTNWYDWSLSNWGTKWSDCDTEIYDHYKDHVTTVRYNTAWSPAEDLIRRISAKFPDLVFVTCISEETYDFAGCFIYAAGIHLDSVGLETSRYRTDANENELSHDDWLLRYEDMVEKIECDLADLAMELVDKYVGEYLGGK